MGPVLGLWQGLWGERQRPHSPALVWTRCTRHEASEQEASEVALRPVCFLSPPEPQPGNTAPCLSGSVTLIGHPTTHTPILSPEARWCLGLRGTCQGDGRGPQRTILTEGLGGKSSLPNPGPRSDPSWVPWLFITLSSKPSSVQPATRALGQ